MSTQEPESTEVRWYDDAGMLIRTDEVAGNAAIFVWDPEGGGMTAPFAPEPPEGAAHMRTRLRFARRDHVAEADALRKQVRG